MNFDPQSLIITIVIGVIAGFLAGQIFRSSGFGFIGNLIVGIAGSFIGPIVFNALSVSIGGSALIAAIVSSTIGALVLLFIVSILRRA